MGLMDGILGNASKVDAAQISTEYAQLLGSEEQIEHAYKLVDPGTLAAYAMSYGY